MSATIAAADLNCHNGLGIETQHKKGTPIHFIVRIHKEDYAVSSALIMDVAYGAMSLSQRTSPNGMATCGEIFAGVSARCRSPCLAASTIYLWEPLFLA